MYGITLWGSAYKIHLDKIKIVQKRVVRSIYDAEYNEYTHTLFTELGLLKLEDIYKYEISKFMYYYLNKTTPLTFQLNIKYGSNVHSYSTRQAKALRIPRHRLRSTSSLQVY